jgi:hypothetical protein
MGTADRYPLKNDVECRARIERLRRRALAQVRPGPTGRSGTAGSSSAFGVPSRSVIYEAGDIVVE